MGKPTYLQKLVIEGRRLQQERPNLLQELAQAEAELARRRQAERDRRQIERVIARFRKTQQLRAGDIPSNEPPSTDAASITDFAKEVAAVSEQSAPSATQETTQKHAPEASAPTQAAGPHSLNILEQEKAWRDAQTIGVRVLGPGMTEQFEVDLERSHWIAQRMLDWADKHSN